MLEERTQVTSDLPTALASGRNSTAVPVKLVSDDDTVHRVLQ
jgi:hypothetical protein